MFTESAPTDTLVETVLDGEAPPHWTLKVGSRNDDEWLMGDWNTPEQGREWWLEIPDATMRWSGARPGVRLPVRPGVDHTLRLSLSVPKIALGASGIEVTVNGCPIGSITKPGRQRCTFAVPDALIGSNDVAILECAVTPWKPSEQPDGSTDPRELGLSMQQIEIFRLGEESREASAVILKTVVNRTALAPLTRAIDKGRTLYLKDRADDIQLLAALLMDSLPGLPDGRLDGKFATETEDGVLWFDAATARIWLDTK
jgi:hypothetical protein